MSTKNGVKSPGSNGSKDQSPQVTSSANLSSRKFSIFVNADARPQVDRFWIMNDYEVEAPSDADPTGGNAKVNVLLLDAKKKDALKFLSQLSKWDEHFQIFQQAKIGTASWLAPFDVAKAPEAEGDYWTLQIILIDK